jgi:hypothetical protein
MTYRDLLNQLQKFSDEKLSKMVTVYDYETDTIMEDSPVGLDIARVDIKNYGINYPFITIN